MPPSITALQFAVAHGAAVTELKIGDLVVSYRGPNQAGADSWAVRDGGCCLNTAGEFEYEPQPSSRSEAFLARTRFPFEAAIVLAVRASKSPVAAATEF